MRFGLILIIILILSATLPASAEDREFDGYGGFHISFYSPDLQFLNDKLQVVTPGFDEVNNTMMLWGGGGCGQVAPHWRIGGYGFGGGTSVSGSFSVDGQTYPQDVEVGMGGGGFYCEYIVGHAFTSFEGAVGLGFGGMGVSMDVTQYRGDVTWDDMMEGLQPGNEPSCFKISASNGGLFLNPSLASSTTSAISL